MGWNYHVNNINQVQQYLNQHPDLLQRYIQKLNSTPQIPANFDDFYQAAVWIKTKGVQSYNRNKKGYASLVQQAVGLLKADPTLNAFLKNPVVPARPQFKPGREGGRRGRRLG
jgi:trans-aconitate methyltransferase